MAGNEGNQIHKKEDSMYIKYDHHEDEHIKIVQQSVTTCGNATAPAKHDLNSSMESNF